MSDFNLQEYMSNGVANAIKSAVKATLKNPDVSCLKRENRWKNC